MSGISETINKKAITHYNHQNKDYYAPILKFGKYTNLHFEDNSTFIIKLSLIGYYENVDSCEIYVTTGYDYEFNQRYATIKYLNRPAFMKMYLLENEDNYTLYVCSNKYNTRIIAQLIYATNSSYIEPLNFNQFDVTKPSSNVIEVLHENLKQISDQTYATSIWINGNQYTQFLEIELGQDGTGVNMMLDIMQSSNDNTEFVCGRIAIKARKQDSLNHIIRLYNVGGNEDFNINNFNIIAVQARQLNLWRLYIEIKKSFTGYYIKPSMIYNDNHKARVDFMENQEFTTLPDGAQDLLFMP